MCILKQSQLFRLKFIIIIIIITRTMFTELSLWQSYCRFTHSSEEQCQAAAASKTKSTELSDDPAYRLLPFTPITTGISVTIC